jgi:hypothetical protein
MKTKTKKIFALSLFIVIIALIISTPLIYFTWKYKSLKEGFPYEADYYGEVKNTAVSNIMVSDPDFKAKFGTVNTTLYNFEFTIFDEQTNSVQTLKFEGFENTMIREEDGEKFTIIDWINSSIKAGDYILFYSEYNSYEEPLEMVPKEVIGFALCYRGSCVVKLQTKYQPFPR